MVATVLAVVVVVVVVEAIVVAVAADGNVKAVPDDCSSFSRNNQMSF